MLIPRRLWLFAFAIRAGIQAMRIPGATRVRAPLHLAAVDRAPTGISIICWLQHRRRRGPLAVALCSCSPLERRRTAAAICSSRVRCRTCSASAACFRVRSASCWRAVQIRLAGVHDVREPGARPHPAACRSSFRSSTSLMVYMICMLPTLSWMLSEAGASLMGQVAGWAQRIFPARPPWSRPLSPLPCQRPLNFPALAR